MHEVIDTLNLLFSTLKDAETGQRGYIISSDETCLKPYDDAIGIGRGSEFVVRLPVVRAEAAQATHLGRRR